MSRKLAVLFDLLETVVIDKQVEAKIVEITALPAQNGEVRILYHVEWFNNGALLSANIDEDRLTAK